MLKSKRARRMDRKHKRRQTTRLSLVSLMDIFTILVFFLLVNSSEVEVLPSSRVVEVPESVAQQKPRETLVVMITEDQIILRGRPVAEVAGVLQSEGATIPSLEAALARVVGEVPGEITVMGDRRISFSLLRRVMASCAAAGFDKVSLAVVQKGA